MDEKTKRIVKQLESQGFEVKRKVEIVKHTFEVPTDTLKLFKEILTTKKMKMKDGVAEAFQLWVDKNKPRR